MMRTAVAYRISWRRRQEIRRRALTLISSVVGGMAAALLFFSVVVSIGEEVRVQSGWRTAAGSVADVIGKTSYEVRSGANNSETEAAGAAYRKFPAAQLGRWEAADGENVYLVGNAAFLIPQVEMKTMYLTFDDGPSKENTDKILDVLQEKGIQATFFVIGEYVEKFPDTARRIVEEGHTIGVHCYVHDYSTLYASPESYIADFEKAYETIYEITGVEAKLFRFPGGSVTNYSRGVCEDIVRELEARGFIYFDWNASLEDTAGSKTPEELITYARESTMDRERVVMLAHDRVSATAECMADLLDSFSDYRMEPLTAQIEPVQFRRFWENK